MALVASVLACGLMKSNAVFFGGASAIFGACSKHVGLRAVRAGAAAGFGLEVSPPRADVGFPPHKFLMFRYLVQKILDLQQIEVLLVASPAG